MSYTKEELDELKSDYYQSLLELNTTAINQIETLTEIAQENKDVAAEMLVEAVEQRIQEAPVKEILPALYLLDSICKRVRKPYIELFSQNLVSTFTASYEKVADPKTRIFLLKLLKTWAQIFPPDLVWKIEQRMRARYKVHKELEPKIGARFSTKISVNPDFFQRPNNVPTKVMSQPKAVKKERTPAPRQPKMEQKSNGGMDSYAAPPPAMDQQQFGAPLQQPPPGPHGGVPPQQPPPGFGGPPQQPPPGQYGPPQFGPQGGMQSFGVPGYGPPQFGPHGGMPPQQPPPGFGGPPQQPAPGGFPPQQMGYGPPQQPPPGGMPPQQPPPGMYGVHPQQPVPSDLASILDALGGGASSLDKGKHAQTIHQLYDGFKLKCNVCGLRFHIQSQLDEHLDRHIERKQEMKKTLARKWFQEDLDWDKEIIMDPMESPQAIVFGELAHGGDKKRKFSEMSSPTDDGEQGAWKESVPADPDQEICPVCHEPFAKYFDDEEQEWMYGGAKRDNNMESDTYDQLVHVSCLNFHNSGSPQSPATKRIRPNEVFS